MYRTVRNYVNEITILPNLAWGSENFGIQVSKSYIYKFRKYQSDQRNLRDYCKLEIVEVKDNKYETIEVFFFFLLRNI